MDRKHAFEKLRAIKQQHIFAWYDELTPSKKEKLLRQISKIDIPVFRLQQQLLSKKNRSLRGVQPVSNYALRGHKENLMQGQNLIAEGKVACLIIAGGQGTRLQWRGPKGTFPISLIKNKSLFQVFAEKILAASVFFQRKLSVAIMTSSQNHAETVSFFSKNNFFGLNHKQVDFFVQDSLPLLDSKGNLFLSKKEEFATGPDGNGSALSLLVSNGIWKRWYSTGVRFVNVILVDNPLADPFDPELIGHQHNQGADAVIKCIVRELANEKVGILIKQNDRLKVVEYTELSDDERYATVKTSKLKHSLANISLFCFTMDFIKDASQAQLPLHIAHKSAPCLNRNGDIVEPNTPNSWKFERFLFDTLLLTDKVHTLVYPREECFAPLKNAFGEASVSNVQRALLFRDRAIIRNLTNTPAPPFPIELAQQFYYPTEELKTKWKGKTIQQPGYITP